MDDFLEKRPKKHSDAALATAHSEFSAKNSISTVFDSISTEFVFDDICFRFQPFELKIGTHMR